VTVERCRFRLDEGRSYEEYYSNKRNGWKCFNTVNEIVNFDRGVNIDER